MSHVQNKVMDIDVYYKFILFPIANAGVVNQFITLPEKIYTSRIRISYSSHLF